MIEFKRVNVEKDMAICIKFREDSYRVSFPNSDMWKVYWSEASYKAWVSMHAQKFPDSMLHIWKGDEIIGQLEFSYGNTNAHISLFYLLPMYRGIGYGLLAHEYVISSLVNHGCETASLKVSKTNIPALNFYKKLGWVVEGSDVNNDHMLNLKINL